MLTKKMIIQLVQAFVFFFIILFTNLYRDGGNIAGAIIVSLAFTAITLPFMWRALRELEIKEQKGASPSIVSVIKDTNISKFSLIGAMFFIIFICLVFLKIEGIYNESILPGFISLFIGLIFMIYGAFFGADKVDKS